MTTYNPNVPNPNDSPSQDVSDMQTNAASISTWCGSYDHFGLNNVANTGYHQKVTFGATNSPSVPTDPVSILYTQNDTSSHPQLRFLNSQNSSQYVVAANGVIPLFAGIILQWGSVVATTSGTSFSFPITFPNNVFAVTLGGRASGAQAFSMATPSTSAVTVYCASGSQTCYVIAIGN